jgi:2-dehydro-3-deoxyphosphogalactonate aldolase
MNFQDAFAEMPLVAILRGVKPDEIVALAEALIEADIRIVEVPLNSPQPLVSISRLADRFAGRLVCGAGTVLNARDVDAVADAGGQIVVSPNTNPAVIRRTVERELTPLPGFATATEAFAALDAGATHLKLFPASTYGPSHVTALTAVLPASTRILAVGGVGPEQMADWWAAGVRGFGLGSDLYKAGRGVADVFARAKAAVEAVRNLPKA